MSQLEYQIFPRRGKTLHTSIQTGQRKIMSNKMRLTKICKQGILIKHSSIVHFYVIRAFKITYNIGTPLHITPSQSLNTQGKCNRNKYLVKKSYFILSKKKRETNLKYMRLYKRKRKSQKVSTIENQIKKVTKKSTNIRI